MCCHLDSWDLGTGALDDGVGCGIVTAAVLNTIKVSGAPKRTIRVIWFGSEEVGVLGGRHYATSQQPTIETHVFAGESDSGAGTIYQADFKFSVVAKPIAEAIARSLRPLRVTRGTDAASGAPDVGPLSEIGVPIVDLQQDFALHHTPDDTIERVDPAKVRQNVAAWSVVAWYAGWTTLDFRTGR
jgi:carboxypeptidase Q